MQKLLLEEIIEKIKEQDTSLWKRKASVNEESYSTKINDFKISIKRKENAKVDKPANYILKILKNNQALASLKGYDVEQLYSSIDLQYREYIDFGPGNKDFNLKAVIEYIETSS